MRKRQPSVLLNDIYHTIKSPIVTIKSLLFVLGRNKDVKGNKSISDKIYQLENTVDLLHKRAEIFLNYILFKEGADEFLYSFFSIKDLIKDLIEKLNKDTTKRPFELRSTASKPIMADKDQIEEALRIILSRVQSSTTESIRVDISTSGKTIQIVVKYKTSPEKNKSSEPINSDEECIAREMDYIAKRIIELHGGSILSRTKGYIEEINIIVPFKAKNL